MKAVLLILLGFQCGQVSGSLLVDDLEHADTLGDLSSNLCAIHAALPESLHLLKKRPPLLNLTDD